MRRSLQKMAGASLVQLGAEKQKARGLPRGCTCISIKQLPARPSHEKLMILSSLLGKHAAKTMMGVVHRLQAVHVPCGVNGCLQASSYRVGCYSDRRIQDLLDVQGDSPSLPLPRSVGGSLPREIYCLLHLSFYLFICRY